MVLLTSHGCSVYISAQSEKGLEYTKYTEAQNITKCDFEVARRCLGDQLKHVLNTPAYVYCFNSIYCFAFNSQQNLTQVFGIVRTFGLSYSEGNQKKAPGNKLSAAAPLPGKNGTPTFAAVAAGYDKSPGKYITINTLISGQTVVLL